MFHQIMVTTTKYIHSAGQWNSIPLVYGRKGFNSALPLCFIPLHSGVQSYKITSLKSSTAAVSWSHNHCSRVSHSSNEQCAPFHISSNILRGFELISKHQPSVTLSLSSPFSPGRMWEFFFFGGGGGSPWPALLQSVGSGSKRKRG